MGYYRSIVHGTDNRSRMIRDAGGPMQGRRQNGQDRAMRERRGRDRQWPRDHEQAKARIKELLDDAKFQHFTVALRLRDQLRAVYNDVETLSAEQFLDELIEWLAAKHLRD